jgi:hypothetical protein
MCQVQQFLASAGAVKNSAAVLSASMSILMVCIVGIQSIKAERAVEWQKAQNWL